VADTHELILARELEILSNKRELAALNCVNAIQFVLLMFEADDFNRARQHLQEALDGHKKADDAVSEFHVRLSHQLKKENQSHGRNQSVA
jgi:hypothetical protein